MAEAGADWTAVEIEATVAAYFEMLDLQRAGNPYVKADYRRRLREGPLSARSDASLEFKFQNISAVLAEMDDGCIDVDAGEGDERGFRTVESFLHLTSSDMDVGGIIERDICRGYWLRISQVRNYKNKKRCDRS